MPKILIEGGEIKMTRTDFAQTGFITRRTAILRTVDVLIQTLLLVAVMVMLSGFIYFIH